MSMDTFKFFSKEHLDALKALGTQQVGDTFNPYTKEPEKETESLYPIELYGYSTSVFFNDDIEDLEDEEYRHYVFDDHRSVMILFPMFMYINNDGSHVVVDEEGVYHLIPPGWIQLEVEYTDNA